MSSGMTERRGSFRPYFIHTANSLGRPSVGRLAFPWSIIKISESSLLKSEVGTYVFQLKSRKKDHYIGPHNSPVLLKKNGLVIVLRALGEMGNTTPIELDEIERG